MFKVIMFVCKKETLSTEEFIARWQLHSEKVSQFRTVLNIKAYTKTFPSKPEHSPSSDRKTLPFVFDAMGELWYENKEEFVNARNSIAGKQALAALKADEETFIDLTRSVMWLGQEEVVW